MPNTPIATQAEANALAEHKTTLVSVPTLTPGGELETVVHEDVEARRQRRLAFIQNRLASASYRMRRDNGPAFSQ